MKTHASLQEISAAIHISRRLAHKRATRERWPFTEQAVRGGRRRLYQIATLPEAIRIALIGEHLSTRAARQAPGGLDELGAGVGSTPEARLSSTRGAVAHRSSPPTVASGATPDPRSPSIGDLAKWQIEVATARAELIDECERIAAASAIHIARAEQLLAKRAKTGELPAALLDLARLANARRGGNGRRVSHQRLGAWRKRARGAATPSERLARLAPGGRGKRWVLCAEVTAALAQYRSPNKPSLRWCVQEIAGRSGPAFNSLYARCRRELKKLPAALFYAGRNSGSALKALQPFRRREFLSLAPNDVWTGDGHSAKLRIQHPDTGAPFVPEVTVIVDVATRYVVGWSVSLSENCIAVSDALRHGVSRHGVPLVYYSDNGGGQKNKMFDAPVTGVLTGMGIQHETGIPGNAQGRGVIERLWPTVLLRLAKRFATYQGKGADRETLRKVTIDIERALRAAKKSEVTAMPRRLPSFRQFLDAIEAEIEAYNTMHRHRSLPKLDGVEHATPAEYRAHRLDGAQLQVPPAQEVAALFMPSVLRVAARGEVKLWNGIYFHRDLMLADREEVAVGYDIHDATYVLVRKTSGEFLARAELAGNRSGYMPKPFLEKLRDEREARRLKLLEDKIGEVQAERRAGTSFAAEIAPEEFARLEREFLAPPPFEQPIELMGEMDRFYLWKKLHVRKADGEQLDERMSAFYEGFKSAGQSYLQQELDFERRLSNG